MDSGNWGGGATRFDSIVEKTQYAQGLCPNHPCFTFYFHLMGVLPRIIITNYWKCSNGHFLVTLNEWGGAGKFIPPKMGEQARF